MPEARIGLIGAGFIAATHLEALKAIPRVSVTAVIDPNVRAAERLSRQAPGARAFGSIAEAVAARALDRAHVLVPPQLHRAVTAETIAAGLPTLVEKPLGTTKAEAAELVELAQRAGVPLGVNQNFMFDAGIERFVADLHAGKYGRLRHVTALCAVPLRQLAAGQFGHWMFERPSNIVLEQMVHPLSQLVRLMGPLIATSAVAKAPMQLAAGLDFHQAFDVSLKGATATAQLHMAFGEAYLAWQLTCLCDDAMVVIDGLRSQVHRYGRTRFLEQGERALTTARVGVSQIGQATAGVLGYLAGQLKLARRSDPFFRSMLASIQAFHEAVDNGQPPPVDAKLGAHVVDLCFDIVRLTGVSEQPAPRPKVIGRSDPVPKFDVAVFGGTGFIGKATVKKLVAAGYSVGVMARNMQGLPEVLQQGPVSLIAGDATKREDVARGIGSARYVVNLASGGASGSREAIVAAICDSARLVAEVCLAQGIERLVHIGSIAALYLGDASETITPLTATDAKGAERADYSFAKAESERLLLAMQKEKGLPVTIQRPGVVVGEGASPFHSGVGLFNNEQHCLGWSSGSNALPFVLVDDCADAIVCALKADASVNGRTDNIVGAVRLSARDYIEELARALGRPLKYHPGALWKMQSVELGKWLIKRAGGSGAPLPSSRDLSSRGLHARFDTADTERFLNWHPTSDRERFIDQGIRRPALMRRPE